MYTIHNETSLQNMYKELSNKVLPTKVGRKDVAVVEAKQVELLLYLTFLFS